MTTVKKIEDLTFEEVKEQLAFYNRLYYAFKAKECPDFLAKKRERQRRHYAAKRQKQKLKQELRENNIFQTKNTLHNH